MKKNNFISLQCSSESFEKSIALYYYAIKCTNFYNNYNVNVFYGHNLPKKDKNIAAQGTISFYDKYYSKNKIIKYCDKKSIIKLKKNILNFLLKKTFLTAKNIEKYLIDDIKYWDFVSKLPFEYLFPNHAEKIINIAEKKLSFKLIPLYLETNYINILLKVENNNKFRYCIYILELDGRIGKYYLDYNDINSFAHYIKMIDNKPVMSGNSAIFLEQIRRRLRKEYILGYRLHSKNIRPNRNYVLNKILDEYNCILEPKNEIINKKFANLDDKLSMEQKANLVYASAYYDFLHEYKKDLNLNEIEEEWYYENN